MSMSVSVRERGHLLINCAWSAVMGWRQRCGFALFLSRRAMDLIGGWFSVFQAGYREGEHACGGSVFFYY